MIKDNSVETLGFVLPNLVNGNSENDESKKHLSSDVLQKVFWMQQLMLEFNSFTSQKLENLFNDMKNQYEKI